VIQTPGTREQRRELADFRLFQVSRNASTVLACPFRTIWNLIDRPLLHFSEEPLSLDPIFAGHFQRIIEGFFRAIDGTQDWFTVGDLDKLITFCLDHIDILTDHQILYRFVTDFAHILEVMTRMHP
jgi:hypothetical protein